jgi:hypothetical protein
MQKRPTKTVLQYIDFTWHISCKIFCTTHTHTCILARPLYCLFTHMYVRVCVYNILVYLHRIVRFYGMQYYIWVLFNKSVCQLSIYNIIFISQLFYIIWRFCCDMYVKILSIYFRNLHYFVYNVLHSFSIT